jgi:hypothetical protein
MARLSTRALNAVKVAYYRIFICKAPARRFGTTFTKWRLILGDTLFVCFVLATSLVTFSLGSHATVVTMRAILTK